VFCFRSIVVVRSQGRLWKPRGSAAIEIDDPASLSIVWNRALSFPLIQTNPPLSLLYV
jgi:hypothetical protein